jgi:hypothetical protein
VLECDCLPPFPYKTDGVTGTEFEPHPYNWENLSTGKYKNNDWKVPDENDLKTITKNKQK